jgi:putative membrane protein
MSSVYWNNLFSGGDWIYWCGLFFLIFLIAGNWGYTYRLHRRFNGLSPEKSALDLLKERYALGEVTRDDFLQTKSEIVEAKLFEDKSRLEKTKDLKKDLKKDLTRRPGSDFATEF